MPVIPTLIEWAMEMRLAEMGGSIGGRGAIMTTGKENYLKFDKQFGLKGELIKNPDLLKSRIGL